MREITWGVPSLSMRGTKCSGAYFDSSLFILASSLSPSGRRRGKKEKKKKEESSNKLQLTKKILIFTQSLFSAEENWVCHFYR